MRHRNEFAILHPVHFYYDSLTVSRVNHLLCSIFGVAFISHKICVLFGTSSGGISVCSFKKTDNHPPNVDHMDPYMHNDFERTSPSCTVGDMIRHLNHYTHLYPNIPKGVAFNGFYSESKSSSDRYSLKKRMY